MEVRHFVYGKFNSRIPDFGIRVMDGSAPPEELTERYNEIISYFLGHFRPLFYAAFPAVNPEIICKINDQYVYARFFPPFAEERGTMVECLFHAFVFTSKEMEAINYCPWRLRKKFIKAYSPEEITGYDDQSWVKKTEVGTTPYVIRKIDITAVTGDAFPSFYNPFTPYYVIDSGDPDTVLLSLSVPHRLALFASGIMLNCTAKLLNSLYAKELHAIFINDQIQGAIPDYFTPLAPDELKILTPVESALNNRLELPAAVTHKQQETVAPDIHQFIPVITVAPASDLSIVNERQKLTISFRNENNFDVLAVIERKIEKTGSDFTEIHHHIRVDKNTTGTYTDHTENGKEYSYRIQFKVPDNAASSSTYTGTGPVKTYPVEIDSSSVTAVVHPDLSGIRLSWRAPENSYPVVYEVSRTALVKGVPQHKMIIEGGVAENGFLDKDVAGAGEYIYQIKVIEPLSRVESLPAATGVIKILGVSNDSPGLENNSLSNTDPVPAIQKKPYDLKKYLLIGGIAFLSLCIVIFIYFFFFVKHKGTEKITGYTVTGSKVRIIGDQVLLVGNSKVYKGEPANGEWKISNEEIAGIDKKGEVTAKAEGETQLIYSLKGFITDSVPLTVTKEYAVKHEWEVNGGATGTIRIEGNKITIGDKTDGRVNIAYKIDNIYHGFDLRASRIADRIKIDIHVPDDKLLNSQKLTITGKGKFSKTPDSKRINITDGAGADFILKSGTDDVFEFIPSEHANKNNTGKPKVAVKEARKDDQVNPDQGSVSPSNLPAKSVDMGITEKMIGNSGTGNNNLIVNPQSSSGNSTPSGKSLLCNLKSDINDFKNDHPNDDNRSIDKEDFTKFYSKINTRFFEKKPHLSESETKEWNKLRDDLGKLNRKFKNKDIPAVRFQETFSEIKPCSNK